MRTGVGLVVIVVCGGCNAILGLDRTHLRDGDAGAIDAIPADANPDDTDGDGVANAQDDCPTTWNPDQADEDGDGVGNVCDDCPEVSDSDQIDVGELNAGAAADGIGDACDPNPALGGDERVLFEPFDDPSHLAGWKTPVGAWSIAGGALHQTDTTAQDALAWLDRSLSPTRVVVFGQLEAVPMLGTGELRTGAWVMDPASAPTGDGVMPDGYLCGVVEAQPNATGASARVMAVAGNLSYSLAENPLAVSLAPGQPVSFALEVSGKTPPVSCFAGLPGAGAVVSIGDTKFPGGAPAVFTHDLGVAFTSVTVYSR